MLPTETGMLTEPGAFTEISDPPDPEPPDPEPPDPEPPDPEPLVPD